MTPRGHFTSALVERATGGGTHHPVDNRFGERDSHILRVCSISSSCSSILAGLVAFYMFGAIDHKKRVFRHQLIVFLIFFDLIKLAVLLIYPSRIETKYLAYYNHNFCEIVGFFTSLSIEGADIAILSFAIHTGLLIFRPNAKVKIGNNMEGGLFKYRFYVYLISFLTPCVLLSLAFVNGSGYRPLTTWCYLPQEPRWFRLVLSWVPRYLIVIVIVIIYVSIYYYVTKQYSIVGGKFRTMHGEEDNDEDLAQCTKWNRTWRLTKRGYRTFQKYTAAVLFPELNMFPYDENTTSLDLDEAKLESDDSHHDPVNNKSGVQDKLHSESYHLFQIRRLQIQKQIKSIFIYPISYIFLWSFPFLLQCFEFHDSTSHILWLNATLAFFQPFNCTVDTLVFLYRERPWNLTTLRTDTNPNEDFQYPNWKRRISWLPLYGLPTRESNQLKLRKFAQKQLEDLKLRSGSDSMESSTGEASNNNNNNNNNNKHDFSNILAGSDMDFVKLPQPPRARTFSGNSVTRPTTLNTATSNPFKHNPTNSDVDPMDFQQQQRLFPTGRRRSSKLSWLSATTTEGRKSSTGGSVLTFHQQQQRKKASFSSSDTSETSPQTPSFFTQSYTVADPSTPVTPALPEISETAASSSKNALEAQHSPTSPGSVDTEFFEPHRPLRVSSFNSLHHTHQQPLRSLSNAFGLARRPSFLENVHSKSMPTIDNQGNSAGNEFGFRSGSNAMEEEDESNEDDMDFMDFLNKGPPV